MSVLNTLGYGATSYTDTTVVTGKTYRYGISGANLAGEGTQVLFLVSRLMVTLGNRSSHYHSSYSSF